MSLLATSGIDLLLNTFKASYPIFKGYAEVTLLYIGAAGIMVQVIKSMRG